MRAAAAALGATMAAMVCLYGEGGSGNDCFVQHSESKVKNSLSQLPNVCNEVKKIEKVLNKQGPFTNIVPRRIPGESAILLPLHYMKSL